MRTTITDPSEGRFVVGVDFGTTFTSVAFAHSSVPEDVKLVQSWPHGATSGETADQVPTELHYTSIDRGDREYQWGYGIGATRGRNRPTPLKWFKLLLQRKPTTSSVNQHHASALSQISEAMRQLTTSANPLAHSDAALSATPASATNTVLQQLGIEPATVAGDFLKRVRETAQEAMERSYDKQFVAASSVAYIITIPAIWSDAAKAAMVRACEAAGFGAHRESFHLVSEPEAAAAHTLKVIQPHDLKEDATFVICDAGGGTVDLISYKIRSMDPLLIDEVVSGSGDLCGAVYLDDAFRAYIDRRLGSSLVARMSTRSVAAMEKSWQEQVKFKFTSDPKSQGMLFEVSVPGLPDDEELDIEESYHMMKREDVEGIFDPIVDRIIELVDQQVTAVEGRNHNVAAILLVGGFGSSKYLYERLQSARYGCNQREIEIIQPVNAKTAIARGALLRGLDGSSVAAKRARRFYGIKASCVLSEFPGGSARAYIDNIDGHERVPGCLLWYIKKNDVVTSPHTHSIDLYRAVPTMYPASFVFESKVFAFDDEPAPDLDWCGRGPDVYPLCKIVADLSLVPRVTIPVVTGRDGLQYYRVDYTIQMTMRDDVWTWELLYRGVSYGEVTPKFE